MSRTIIIEIRKHKASGTKKKYSNLLQVFIVRGAPFVTTVSEGISYHFQYFFPVLSETGHKRTKIINIKINTNLN